MDMDLNLLVIFDAMARLRTGEEIGLSQPATSAALVRLRVLFDDALFVRAGAQMRPTPRALELAPLVQRVVEMVRIEILQLAGFDPARADRSFTILTPDIGEIAFFPGLLRRLRVEAPGVRLRAVSLPRQATAEALEAGEAELTIGFFPDLQKAGFFQQGLFKTSYACWGPAAIAGACRTTRPTPGCVACSMRSTGVMDVRRCRPSPWHDAGPACAQGNRLTDAVSLARGARVGSPRPDRRRAHRGSRHAAGPCPPVADSTAGAAASHARRWYRPPPARCRRAGW
jgi:DNA-binding transcriptional LysR family regulator